MSSSSFSADKNNASSPSLEIKREYKAGDLELTIREIEKLKKLPFFELIACFEKMQKDEKTYSHILANLPFVIDGAIQQIGCSIKKDFPKEKAFLKAVEKKLALQTINKTELYLLAHAYYYGAIVKKDHKIALELFEKAMQAGVMMASYDVGYMYAYKNENFSKAKFFFEIANNYGCLDVLPDLILNYFKNSVIQEKLKEITELCDLYYANNAIRKKDYTIFIKIAGEYFKKNDNKSAENYIEKAMKRNRKKTLEYIAYNYSGANNFPRDTEKALKFFQQALNEYDSIYAAKALGEMYQRHNELVKAVIHYRSVMHLAENKENSTKDVNDFKKDFSSLSSKIFYVPFPEKTLLQYHYEMAKPLGQADLYYLIERSPDLIYSFWLQDISENASPIIRQQALNKIRNIESNILDLMKEGKKIDRMAYHIGSCILQEDKPITDAYPYLSILNPANLISEENFEVGMYLLHLRNIIVDKKNILKPQEIEKTQNALLSHRFSIFDRMLEHKIKFILTLSKELFEKSYAHLSTAANQNNEIAKRMLVSIALSELQADEKESKERIGDREKDFSKRIHFFPDSFKQLLELIKEKRHSKEVKLKLPLGNKATDAYVSFTLTRLCELYYALLKSSTHSSRFFATVSDRTANADNQELATIIHHMTNPGIEFQPFSEFCLSETKEKNRESKILNMGYLKILQEKIYSLLNKNLFDESTQLFLKNANQELTDAIKAYDDKIIGRAPLKILSL